ncbi:unnamed protein product [Closterium sp. Naga37s-1]|nr:unnamed protein product [Closterium sp. Naga37s-1]
MSGLDSGSFRRPLDSDTVATRFLHGRHSAMQFAVMQLGVCTFKWDEVRREFIVDPFNFKVFPRSEIPGFKGVPAHSFQCQPSSLEFLAAHHLDFNSWVQHGISYLSYEQEEAAWKFLDIPPPPATARQSHAMPTWHSQQGSADVAQPTNTTTTATTTTTTTTTTASSISRYSWRDSSNSSDPSSPPFPGVQFAVKSLARVDLWLAQLRSAQEQQQEQLLARGVASGLRGEGVEEFSGEVAVGRDGSSSSSSSSSNSGLQPALAAVVGKRPWLSLRINDAFNCHAADQAIRYKHPYLASHEERIGAYKRVRLFLCGSKEEAEELQKRLLELRQAGAAAVVRRAVGVRRVVDALSLACQTKPLVAHSCFLDLAHILHKFVGHVPPSPSLFSREVTRLFPALFDTSCLAAASLLAQVRAGQCGAMWCNVVRHARSGSYAAVHPPRRSSLGRSSGSSLLSLAPTASLLLHAYLSRLFPALFDASCLAEPSRLAQGACLCAAALHSSREGDPLALPCPLGWATTCLAAFCIQCGNGSCQHQQVGVTGRAL